MILIMPLLYAFLTLLIIRTNVIFSFTIGVPNKLNSNAIASSSSSNASDGKSLTSTNNNDTSAIKSRQKQLRRSFLKNTILSTLITNYNIFGINKAVAYTEENKNIYDQSLLSSSNTLSSSSFLSSSTSLSSSSPSSTTNEAEITDKIYITFKGIVNDPTSTDTKRITIGLFGKNAPKSTSIIKQLVSKSTGYKTSCKPLPTRLLEREQLEANKVYNNCMANEQEYGVTYENSSVWRVQKDKRIDAGAVVGKYLSRENAYFEEDTANNLLHDTPGIVSVRRGNEGGFGFTIQYYNELNKDVIAAQEMLNQDNIIIGRVIEGMDVVDELNNLPVVKSSSVNYMGLTGGPTVKNEATRACRYGGPMYCNENKPLRKIQIVDCGVL